MARVAASGTFGGEYSRPAAQAMFNRHPAEAIDDVRAKTRIPASAFQLRADDPTDS
jgi:hypothetical protein